MRIAGNRLECILLNQKVNKLEGSWLIVNCIHLVKIILELPSITITNP